MKKSLWAVALLAVIPGCLLVQPLDGAASSDGDDIGSKAGANAGGSSSHAGAKGSSGATGDSGEGGLGGTSDAPTTGGKTAPFLGTWTATSGTLTITCEGIAPTTSDATGNEETWSKGITTDLVQNAFEGDCSFAANVSGRTATALPAQTCTENSTDNSGDSITQDFAFEDYQFIVSSDGTTATETFSGNDTYTDNTQGRTIDCAFTEYATFEM